MKKSSFFCLMILIPFLSNGEGKNKITIKYDDKSSSISNTFVVFNDDDKKKGFMVRSGSDWEYEYNDDKQLMILFSIEGVINNKKDKSIIAPRLNLMADHNTKSKFVLQVPVSEFNFSNREIRQVYGAKKSDLTTDYLLKEFIYMDRSIDYLFDGRMNYLKRVSNNELRLLINYFELLWLLVINRDFMAIPENYNSRVDLLNLANNLVSKREIDPGLKHRLNSAIYFSNHIESQILAELWHLILDKKGIEDDLDRLVMLFEYREIIKLLDDKKMKRFFDYSKINMIHINMVVASTLRNLLTEEERINYKFFDMMNMDLFNNKTGKDLLVELQRDYILERDAMIDSNLKPSVKDKLLNIANKDINYIETLIRDL